MSRFDNQLALPPAALIDHDALRPLVDDYHRLTSARREAYAAVSRLNQEHDAALETERATRAVAIREGKPDPGTKRSDKLAADVKAQLRTVEATEDAIAATRRDLVAAVERHRDEWADTVEAAVEAARDRYLAAVDELEVAHAHMGSAANLRSWLRDFPGEARWKPGTYYQRVKGLPGRGSEESLGMASALAALRNVGAPPPPPAGPAQHVPPGGRQSGRLSRDGLPQRDAQGPLHPSAPPAVEADVYR